LLLHLERSPDPRRVLDRDKKKISEKNMEGS